jgi:hypothetical protein
MLLAHTLRICPVDVDSFNFRTNAIERCPERWPSMAFCSSWEKTAMTPDGATVGGYACINARSRANGVEQP